LVNFALFGAGRIGRMHAENLAQRSDAKLLYVVDTKPEKRRRPSRIRKSMRC
jgi:saccharopine dehydrogenase-like NADP-dependent oxidoreductase